MYSLQKYEVNMELISFIKNNPTNFKEQLKNDFGITAKYDTEISEKIATFCYDQIASPKTHALTRESRGITIDTQNLVVLGRPFDRFYNYGEVAEETLSVNLNDCSTFEKIDGSLLTFYFSPEHNLWKISTKTTPFSRNAVTRNRVPFLHIISQAIGIKTEDYFLPENQFFLNKENYYNYIHAINEVLNNILDKKLSYIIEMTSPHNKIVTQYDKPELHLLAIRKPTGEYINIDKFNSSIFKKPKKYSISSKEELQKVVSSMNKGNIKTLKEGVVVMDNKTGIRTKFKNTAYLKIHKMLGTEEISEKQILDIVMDNEEEEFFIYYPQSKNDFQKYIKAREKSIEQINEGIQFALNNDNKKEVAQKLNKMDITGPVFSSIKNGINNPQVVWSNTNKKIKEKIMKKFIF